MRVTIPQIKRAISILRKEPAYYHRDFKMVADKGNYFCAIGAIAEARFESQGYWGGHEVVSCLRKQLRSKKLLKKLKNRLMNVNADVTREEAISILKAFITDLRRK